MDRIYITYSCGKTCNISINSDLGKIVIANYTALPKLDKVPPVVSPPPLQDVYQMPPLQLQFSPNFAKEEVKLLEEPYQALAVQAI
jgi:hypothetical protein